MIQRLRQLLSQSPKRHIVDANRVPAAVLVPLYDKLGQFYVLFTRRTEQVTEHKGQISFPGGAYEKDDRTLQHTALRECAEEIGLMAEDTEVLGELNDEVSLTSNYVISSFVALIPWPYKFKLNRAETEEIIEVPVSALLDKSCLRQETETLDGEEITSYFYHYQGRIIWGATARILSQFLGFFVRVTGDKP
ncbi:NUDIX hydrolase [Chloroflexota bacterium]